MTRKKGKKHEKLIIKDDNLIMQGGNSDGDLIMDGSNLIMKEGQFREIKYLSLFDLFHQKHLFLFIFYFLNYLSI